MRPSLSWSPQVRFLHSQSLHGPYKPPLPSPTLTSIPKSTINSSEVAHFSRLSSQWWDEQGEFSLLHKMNPVRMQFIREKLVEIAREEQGEGAVDAKRGNILRGLDVLDVGCGGGLLSESLARLGARTLGIDASESNIAIATMHASADPTISPSSISSSLAYRHTPAESLLSEPKRFDVVCSMEVIEHVDNPASFLSTCAELVKPGGHLFLSTIARTPLSYLIAILAVEHIFRVVTPGTHTHSKFVNPSELVAFFQNYPSTGSQPHSTHTHTTSYSYSRTWISPTLPEPTRTEAEIRGLIYNPLRTKWFLAPRAWTWGATECNYLFWVRKPALQ